MQLTEQHVISKHDPRFAAIDAAAFASKNLYNAALYEMRQAFIFQGKYLTYNQLDKRMQSHEAYRALPAKVSQQILMVLVNNWTAFREALKAYEEDLSKFTGRPKIPKYKHKQEGRNILIYTMQAISRNKRGLQRGIIKPSQLPIEVKTQQDPKHIDHVRIIPRNSYYVVEVVYSKEPVQANVDPSFCVGIDLGVTNLATITANREGFTPRLVNGRPVKAWNQWYNKRMKELKLCLPKEDRERVTKQMELITNKRNRQMNHYLHAASKCIIDFLVKEGVGTIIVGKNPLWKQEANMGKRNNQNFVQIPHARFMELPQLLKGLEHPRLPELRPRALLDSLFARFCAQCHLYRSRRSPGLHPCISYHRSFSLHRHHRAEKRMHQCRRVRERTDRTYLQIPYGTLSLES